MAALVLADKPALRMLTMTEAAAYVGVKHRTFQACYRLWGVPHFRIGKTVTFRESELEEWLQARRVSLPPI